MAIKQKVIKNGKLTDGTPNKEATNMATKSLQAKPEATNITVVGKSETVEPKKENTNMTSNVSTRKETKKNLSVINYTKEEFEALGAEELLNALTPRVSLGASKKVLVEMIKSGELVFEDPAQLAEWTYKSVVVEGSDLTDVVGKKVPKVTLTSEDFKTLTGQQVAQYISEYTTEKSASTLLLALIGCGHKLAPKQLVRIANSRITVDGVIVSRTANKRVARIPKLQGIRINGARVGA